MNDWRHRDERAELVEALIASQHRCRLLETALREMGEHHESDRSAGAYSVALLARIAVLEQNMERLTRKKAS
jgi:hypothetical protein